MLLWHQRLFKIDFNDALCSNCFGLPPTCFPIPPASYPGEEICGGYDEVQRGSDGLQGQKQRPHRQAAGDQ